MTAPGPQATPAVAATAGRYRKRPVEVTAVQWTGGNAAEIHEFAGHEKFYALTEDDRRSCDDPAATGEVFDEPHNTWILVYDGDWIIRGTAGEFYPNRPAQFAENYEQVTQ